MPACYYATVACRPLPQDISFHDKKGPPKMREEAGGHGKLFHFDDGSHSSWYLSPHTQGRLVLRLTSLGVPLKDKSGEWSNYLINCLHSTHLCGSPLKKQTMKGSREYSIPS